MLEGVQKASKLLFAFNRTLYKPGHLVCCAKKRCEQRENREELAYVKGHRGNEPSLTCIQNPPCSKDNWVQVSKEIKETRNKQRFQKQGNKLNIFTVTVSVIMQDCISNQIINVGLCSRSCVPLALTLSPCFHFQLWMW